MFASQHWLEIHPAGLCASKSYIDHEVYGVAGSLTEHWGTRPARDNHALLSVCHGDRQGPTGCNHRNDAKQKKQKQTNLQDLKCKVCIEWIEFALFCSCSFFLYFFFFAAFFFLHLSPCVARVLPILHAFWFCTISTFATFGCFAAMKGGSSCHPRQCLCVPQMKRQTGNSSLSAVENKSLIFLFFYFFEGRSSLEHRENRDKRFRSCTVISEEGENLKNAPCPNCQTTDKGIV